MHVWIRRPLEGAYLIFPKKTLLKIYMHPSGRERVLRSLSKALLVILLTALGISFPRLTHSSHYLIVANH